MHLSYIPQYTTQNRNVHISVLSGVLWDMGQVHCGICEIGLLTPHISLVMGRYELFVFFALQVWSVSHCSVIYTHIWPCYSSPLCTYEIFFMLNLASKHMWCWYMWEALYIYIYTCIYMSLVSVVFSFDVFRIYSDILPISWLGLVLVSHHSLQCWRISGKFG